jgi:hypothetical protein
LALYILHFTVHENTIFDWAKIISNEITAQLTNFKTEKKFYMSSYLVFSITYCHTFKGLNIARRVKVKVDPVTMWYQDLWRQKVGHHFYEVYNDFVSKFKKLLFGEDTSRLSLEASTFLKGKGILEKMDDYNIIRVFCSNEKPIFLPYYVSDKLFIIEMDRQYKFWFHTFSEKRKNQFIPLPWKVGEIILRGISKIDEYASYFDHSNLRYAEEIKGFDPSHLFYNHLISVGLNPALINSFVSGEEENDSHDPNIQEADRDSDDIETIISTTEHHKERGKPSNEKNAQSPVVSRRSVLPKINPQPETSQQRKIQSNNSGDDEERNPPQGNLENPHKLKIKRKRTNSQQEGGETHAPEHDLLLDNMDLDVDIENITFPDEEEPAREDVQHISTLMVQDEIFSDEETFVVQNASFDRDSKKLVFERTTRVKVESCGLPLIHRTCFLLDCRPFTKLQGMHWIFQLPIWRKKMLG